MRAEGVTIHEVDMRPFKEATAIVREKYAKGDIKDLMHRIQAVE